MKIHHFTLTLATVLFAGVLHAQPVNPASAANPLLAPKPVDTTPKLAYGLMMKQGEKTIFAPCRDQSYALMQDVSTDQFVTKALNMVGLESGKKLYAFSRAPPKPASCQCAWKTLYAATRWQMQCSAGRPPSLPMARPTKAAPGSVDFGAGAPGEAPEALGLCPAWPF